MTQTSRFSIRRGEDRGRADHGWLDSHHSFSFGSYYDPEHMGFRTLRVINEDRVAAGGGFPAHPHADMEIFSWVVSGRLQHRDSMGNSRVLGPGELQLMSAGRGVTHSEFNPGDEPVHFLQIWIEPAERGREPGYSEWRPGDDRPSARRLLISADGREGSARIHQDAAVWLWRPAPGELIEHQLEAGRGAWLQVVSGTLELDGVLLKAGDAASTDHAGPIRPTAMSAGTEVLLFDLG